MRADGQDLIVTSIDEALTRAVGLPPTVTTFAVLDDDRVPIAAFSRDRDVPSRWLRTFGGI